MLEALIPKRERIREKLVSDRIRHFRDNKHLLNEPFLFQGKNGCAVLLLHGWTSTAFELRGLGKLLHKNGFTAYAPLLRGHGTNPKDLESVSWKDWYADADKALDALTKEHQAVFVVGTSIGGNLALLLSQRRKDIVGVVLLATPFRLRNERFGYSFLKMVSLFQLYKKKRYPPTLRGLGASTRFTSYPQYPIKSAFEAYDLIQCSRKNIHHISQPCLMAQSYNDHLVVRDSLERLYDGVGSSQKKKFYVYDAYHTFIADPDKGYVHQEILRFLESHVPNIAPRR